MRKNKFFANVGIIVSFFSFAVLLFVFAYENMSKNVFSDSERLPNIIEEYYSHVLLDSRRVGGCDTLTGNIKPIIIFVNDNNIWSDIEIEENKKVCYDAINDIITEAALYGQILTIEPEFLIAESKGSPKGEENSSWVDAALKSAGIPTKGQINDLLEREYNVDEVPIVFVTKQIGKSCAYSTRTREYIVLYESCDAFRHEFYHLYGANDYYYPDEVTIAAKSIFPETIMLSGRGPIDDLSAYNVGWTDMPSEKAVELLKKTVHVTSTDVSDAKEQQHITGYVVEFVDSFGGVYTGEMEDGNFHGQGIYKYSNGDVYEGSWKSGKQDGQGIYKSSNGDVYEGSWKSGKQDGQGIYKFSNGDVYEGSWKSGQRDGQGIYKSSNGDVYEGSWKSGKRDGQGIYTFANGAKKSGTWHNDIYVK